MKNKLNSIVNPDMESYIAGLYNIDDEIVAEMETRAEDTGMPVVGSSVGRFLMLIALMSKSKKVFEMGSGFGYSAYWFAKGTGSRGSIICTDFSEENKNLALGYLERSSAEARIEFITGNSIEIIKSMTQSFDIIFNDVDKEYYPEVIEPAYSKLNPGGILITDNALWYGRVTEDDGLPSTSGVKRYNELLSEDRRFVTTIIPIRDGVSISIKIQ